MPCAFARARDRPEGVALALAGRASQLSRRATRGRPVRPQSRCAAQTDAIPPRAAVDCAKEFDDRTLQACQIRLSVGGLLRRGAVGLRVCDRYRDLRRRGESCSLQQSRICLNHWSHLTRGSAPFRRHFGERQQAYKRDALPVAVLKSTAFSSRYRGASINALCA
jgi:hypothetical protein